MKKTVCILLTAIMMLCMGAALAETSYVYFGEYGTYVLNEDGSLKCEVVSDYDLPENTLVSPDGDVRFCGIIQGEYVDEELDDYSYSYWKSTILLDETGKPLTGEIYDSIYEENGLLMVERDGLYGMIDWDGKALTDIAYTVLLPVGDGTYLYSKDDSWTEQGMRMGYLDANGKSTELSLKLDWVGPFREGLATAQVHGGLHGFIDGKGRWVIPPVFSSVGEFYGGKAAVYGEYCGLIDTKGNILLPLEYNSVDFYCYAVGEDAPVATDFVLATKDNHLTVYAAEDMHVVTELDDVQYAYCYAGNLISVLLTDYSNIMIDGEGNILAQGDDGDSILDICNGISIVNIGGEYTTEIRDSEGQVLMDGLTYASFLYNEKGEVLGILAGKGQMRMSHWGFPSVVPNTERYGLYDLEMNEILPCKYDWLRSLGENLLIAKYAEKNGVIDINGNWLCEFSDYDYLLD